MNRNTYYNALISQTIFNDIIIGFNSNISNANILTTTKFFPLLYVNIHKIWGLGLNFDQSS